MILYTYAVWLSFYFDIYMHLNIYLSTCKKRAFSQMSGTFILVAIFIYLCLQQCSDFPSGYVLEDDFWRPGRC